MKIQPALATSPIVPNQTIEGMERQPETVREDFGGLSAGDLAQRRMENDLHALNVKSKLGGAGETPAPSGAKDLQGAVDAFEQNTIPQAVRQQTGLSKRPKSW